MKHSWINKFLKLLRSIFKAPSEDTGSEYQLPSDENREMKIVFEADILYVDASGKRTERSITTRSIYSYDEDYAIYAFCHKRKAYRTFLASRIRIFKDKNTGIKITDVPEFLISKFFSTDAGETIASMKLHFPEITILAFISKSDGRLSAKEKSEIAAFLMASKSSKNIDEKILETELKSIDPSPTEFKDALKIVKESKPEICDELLVSIDALLKTKKKPDALTRAAANLAFDALRITKAEFST